MSKFLIFLISLYLTVNLHLPAKSGDLKALDLAIKAQQLYQTGNLADSATTWQQAARAYQEQGDRQGKIKSLINQAQVLQDLGLDPKACDTLLGAFEVKNPDCSSQQINQLIGKFKEQTKISNTTGIGLRSLGNVLKRQGRLEESQDLLKLSTLAIANSTETAATLLSLGNVERAIANQQRDFWSYEEVTEIILRQEPKIALEPYLETFAAYQQAAKPNALPLTRVQARLNYLDLLIEIENWWQKQTARRIKTWQRIDRDTLVDGATKFSDLLEFRLDKAKDNLIAAIDDNWDNIPPTHQSIYARINYARSLERLGKIERVESILQTALADATAIEDKLAASYALGYLGKYYGQQGQLEEAIALTNRALAIAQSEIANDTRELNYLWQSQLGQLLQQQDKIPEAIAAYTLAYDTLESLRNDLNTNNQTVQFEFRQEVKPVYLQLANLLLQDDTPQLAKADIAAVNVKASNLELARQVIESLQLAELNNYFQDPCLNTADTQITIDRLDPHAAVIYPIVLRDRLEIILSVPNKPLQKFTTTVPEATVNQSIDLLYDSLYNPSIDNSAINIFSTTPLDYKEVTANMQTLLPILQQIYSWLIEPLDPILTTNQIQTLVFVLNGKLQNVPISALYDGQKYLLEKYQVALAPSLQLLDTRSTPKDEIKVLAAGLSKQVEIKGYIFPALKYVSRELEQIEDIFPQSRQLLNREFTSANIARQLQGDFSVIHLATHGLFSSDPKQTFIVTGDGKTIDLETLSSLLSSGNTRPELVILSDCDTATGDERAILGLAGVAVKSGTSSTIASLWSVGDASTARLMSQFYREFEDPAVSKVSALQKAQLSLINSLRNNPPAPELKGLPAHPYYWSPYVLVGNWQ